MVPAPRRRAFPGGGARVGALVRFRVRSRRLSGRIYGRLRTGSVTRADARDRVGDGLHRVRATFGAGRSRSRASHRLDAVPLLGETRGALVSETGALVFGRRRGRSRELRRREFRRRRLLRRREPSRRLAARGDRDRQRDAPPDANDGSRVRRRRAVDVRGVGAAFGFRVERKRIERI